VLNEEEQQNDKEESKEVDFNPVSMALKNDDDLEEFKGHMYQTLDPKRERTNSMNERDNERCIADQKVMKTFDNRKMIEKMMGTYEKQCNEDSSSFELSFNEHNHFLTRSYATSKNSHTNSKTALENSIIYEDGTPESNHFKSSEALIHKNGIRTGTSSRLDTNRTDHTEDSKDSEIIKFQLDYQRRMRINSAKKKFESKSTATTQRDMHKMTSNTTSTTRLTSPKSLVKNPMPINKKQTSMAELFKTPQKKVEIESQSVLKTNTVTNRKMSFPHKSLKSSNSLSQSNTPLKGSEHIHKRSFGKLALSITNSMKNVPEGPTDY